MGSKTDDNESAGTVSVVAVIESRIWRFDSRGNFVEDETLREASAAVAELIEAAHELIARADRGTSAESFYSNRLRAALARAGAAP